MWRLMSFPELSSMLCVYLSHLFGSRRGYSSHSELFGLQEAENTPHRFQWVLFNVFPEIVNWLRTEAALMPDWSDFYILGKKTEGWTEMSGGEKFYLKPKIASSQFPWVLKKSVSVSLNGMSVPEEFGIKHFLNIVQDCWQELQSSKLMTDTHHK